MTGPIECPLRKLQPTCASVLSDRADSRPRLKDSPRIRWPRKNKSTVPPEKLALYEKALAAAKIERKGDTNPYTSVNGHMFTHLDTTGSLGVRLSPEDLDAFLKKYKTKLFETYGFVKKDWAAVPDSLLNKTAELSKHFAASYRYTGSLKPKPTSKKKA